MALPKTINTLTLFASAVAGIVGSGWLLSPLIAARMAGPAAILSWIVAGVMMMVIAATFIQLTKAMPITGGTVRFIQRTHGEFAGFSFAWIAWLAWVAVTPIETMALIQYSAHLFPGLMTQGPSPVLTSFGFAVAAGLLLLISLINGVGTKLYGKINHLILAFKLCIPVITAILLLHTQFHGNNFSQFGGFMPGGWHALFGALPLAGVIYSFIGFNPAIQLAAEAKNPQRAIPIAIFGALTVCIVLYTLVQIAFIGALSPDSLAHGWSNLSYAGDTGPFVGLLTGLGLLWFVKALVVDAVVSPFGTAMVQAFAIC